VSWPIPAFARRARVDVHQQHDIISLDLSLTEASLRRVFTSCTTVSFWLPARHSLQRRQFVYEPI